MPEAITDDWIETGRDTELAVKVEEDVKELAILLARVRYPAKVDTGNGKDAAWRQWVPYARIILAAGYRK
jgi:predicted aspartyl protease